MPLCSFIVTSKTNFMFFKQQSVVVYILTSVLSTSIEIPNITKNYINLHIFTCCHWVSAMLIQIYVTLLESFFDWPDIFYSGGLGANRNMSGILGMKLAIIYIPVL